MKKSKGVSGRVKPADDAEARAELEWFNLQPYAARWYQRFKSGDPAGLFAIRRAAQLFLESLSRLAGSGERANPEAAKQLRELLSIFVSRFDRLCHFSPQIYEPIARKTNRWPGMLTCDNDLREMNDELIEKLNLGAECGINYPKKHQWSRKTLGNALALELRSHVEIKRQSWLNRAEVRRQIEQFKKEFPEFSKTESPRSIGPETREGRLHKQAFQMVGKLKLGPLSRENFPDWCKVSVLMLEILYGKKFEDHPRFADYKDSDSAKEHDPNNAGKLRHRSNWRKIVRGAIRRDLLQGFKNIAPANGGEIQAR
jgi:hypothetical protein